MQLEKEQNIVTPLYEDYGSSISSAFTPQRSFSSGSPYQQQQYSPPNASAMPSSQYNLSLNSAPAASTQVPPPATPSISEKAASNELDLNDPSTLEIYSRILLFKDDRMRDELAFSRSLSPKQRRVVHLIAQKLGVYHYSVGEGDERYAVVTRIDPQRVRDPISISVFVLRATAAAAAAATAATPTPAPPYAFSCPICLSDTFQPRTLQLTAGQKIYARYENLAFTSPAPQLSRIKRQHP
jgi:R3H domain